MKNVCQDTITSAAREAGQEKWEVVNHDTREELTITVGELKRHVCRFSNIEKAWKQVTVSDAIFRQIQSSRGESPSKPQPLSRDEHVEIANCLRILMAQTQYGSPNYSKFAHAEYTKLRRRALESVGLNAD